MEFHCLAPFRVRFSETDMAGVVHFSHIFRWAENAESDFFRKHGIAFVESGAGKVIGWPRVKVAAEFFAPARYDDEIFVEIRPKDIPGERSISIDWEFVVYAGTQTGEKKKIAQGGWKTVYAVADVAAGTFQSADALPQALRQILGNR